ncbi:hypothetical protein WAF17_09470 [Bernardetia sp. ABR2-2B]|uniref:hypothetical protein n=1 Tax=Bernardetia sp. ABR2-2B TaxID=3127472 RepID=UPI0030CD077C
MEIHKFEEQLNDLFDYFILADPYTLLDYKNKHNLPNNLIDNFTTTDFGERAIKEGKMITLSQIENYPYTIYFNFSGNSEFSKHKNDLQIRQDGYFLEVKSEQICLFTVPYLKNYSPENINILLKNRKAQIKIANGIYSVSILGGQTEQTTGKEPTFEFMILPMKNKAIFAAENINYSFKIKSEEY